MMYWRAAENGRIGAEAGAFCLAESEDDARAYLGTGGLGGTRLWTIEITDDVLDLGDSIPEAMQRLYEELTFLECDAEQLADLFVECSWPYEILFSSGSYWEVLADAGYSLVRFPDEYPEGCITTAYLGNEMQMEEVQQ